MIIEITGVTSGQSPYDIFICDSTNTSCFFVSGNTYIPPSVIINTDDYFPYQQSLYVRIVDTNGCVSNNFIFCGQKVYQDSNYFIFMDGNNYIFQ
jgi:hypothetical protein